MTDSDKQDEKDSGAVPHEKAVRVVGLVVNALRSTLKAKLALETALDPDTDPARATTLGEARKLLRKADQQLEWAGIEIPKDS